MVELNLLSWREEKKEYERGRTKFLAAASIIVSLCIAAMTHVILAAEVRRDQQKLHVTGTSLPQTGKTAEIENDELPEVQLSAVELAKMLDDAAAAAGYGMCFTNILYHDKRWQLQGMVLSPLSLTAGMRALHEAANAIKLSEFRQIPERDFYQFLLNAETLAARRGG